MDIIKALTEPHENTSKALAGLLRAAQDVPAAGELRKVIEALETGASFDYDSEEYAVAHRVLAPSVAHTALPPCTEMLAGVRDRACGIASGQNSGIVIAVYGPVVWSAAYDAVFAET